MAKVTICLIDPYETITVPPNITYIRLHKSDSNSILLVDSINRTVATGVIVAETQWCFGDFGTTGSAHLRHTGLANALFVDCHVEACDGARFEENGISWYASE